MADNKIFDEKFQGTDEPSIIKEHCLRGTRFHLTYKTHLPKIVLYSYVNEKTPLLHYSIVHETGDKHHPYDHTHMAIWLKSELKTTDFRFYDFPIDIHPHIKYIKTDEHWDHIKTYHNKEDKEPFQDMPICANSHARYVARVQACDTENEVLNIDDKRNTTCHAFTMRCFNNRDKTRYIRMPKNFVPYDWQQFIYNEALKEPLDRAVIYWVWSDKSSFGKTTSMNYLLKAGLARQVFPEPKRAGNCLKDIKPGQHIAIDFTRAHKFTDETFIYLENLSNGSHAHDFGADATMLYFSCSIFLFTNIDPSIALVALPNRIYAMNVGVDPYKVSTNLVSGL